MGILKEARQRFLNWCENLKIEAAKEFNLSREEIIDCIYSEPSLGQNASYDMLKYDCIGLFNENYTAEDVKLHVLISSCQLFTEQELVFLTNVIKKEKAIKDYENKKISPNKFNCIKAELGDTSREAFERLEKPLKLALLNKRN